MNEKQKLQFEMMSTPELASKAQYAKMQEGRLREQRKSMLKWENKELADTLLSDIRHWSHQSRYLEALLSRRQMKLF